MKNIYLKRANTFKRVRGMRYVSRVYRVHTTYYVLTFFLITVRHRRNAADMQLRVTFPALTDDLMQTIFFVLRLAPPPGRLSMNAWLFFVYNSIGDLKA